MDTETMGLVPGKSYPLGEVKFHGLKVSRNIREESRPKIEERRLKSGDWLPFDRKSPPFAKGAKDGAPSSSIVVWRWIGNPRALT